MSCLFAVGCLMLAIATLPLLIEANINENKRYILLDFLMGISMICSVSAIVLFSINLIKQI